MPPERHEDAARALRRSVDALLGLAKADAPAAQDASRELTPSEWQIITMYRAVLVDDQREVLEILERAYKVAQQYQEKFGGAGAEDSPDGAPKETRRPDYYEKVVEDKPISLGRSRKKGGGKAA